MVDVRVLERTDEHAIHAFWALGRDASRDRVVDTWPAWETARPYYTGVEPQREKVFLGVWEGDRLVGGARVDLPLSENTHLAMLALYVHPDARRRGVGTAVEQAAEELVRARGRTTMLADVNQPMPPGDLPFGPSAFAERRGYVVANVDQVKAVDLLATEPTWPALAAAAAERTGGYRILAWTDPTPEEWLAEICRLFTRFLGEIPLGEVDLQPQTWDAERFRAAEARRDANGQQHLLVVAVAPDDTLAGYTDIVTALARPELAEIDSTLVLPEHRGHRLGLAMKVRLHQEIRLRFPDARRVVTGNATVNTWMNAVNDQLGYVVVERLSEMQKRLT